MVESGRRYKIINVKAGNCLDLSGGDNKSIIGYDYHGGENQKWDFERLNNGHYVISNAATGRNGYLGYEHNPEDGQKLVLVNHPQEWDVRQEGDHYRMFVPGTHFNADLSDHGNPTPGTPITLWGSWEGINQMWRLEQV